MKEMLEYKHVMCPKYIRRAESSSDIDAICCKICGTVIAEKMERPVGYDIDRAGNRIKVVRREFVRFPLYTEARIAFDDGSYHVTNGCSNCLHDKLSPEVLQELHVADQEDSPDGYTERERSRRPVGIVNVKVGGEAA